MKQGLKYFLYICFVLIITIPALASAECSCEPDDEKIDRAGARKYQIAAIPSILLAGALGVLFPVLGKAIPALQPETSFFFVIKAFAAGVILSTGFLHVLPEAFEKLTSPCLKNDVWEFPFTGFIAMVSAIGTLSMDAFATSYFRKAHFGKSNQIVGGHEEEHAGHVHVHTHATHGHSHGAVPMDYVDSEAQSMTQLLRNRVIAQVLELGIIVHSVIIGIALGASESPKAVKPLFAALMFHQCFEGMGLGGCITQAKFKWSAVTVMTAFFAFTTPVGIGVGMVISSGYSETNPTALIVQGVLNAASAGILIYMSLVDFLAADFMHPKMQNNCKLQVMAHFSLLLGAGVMSVLAKWA